MKHILFSLALVSSFSWGAPTKLSVLEFDNKANGTGCRFDGFAWWREHLGSAFKEMLIAELKGHSRFRLYERESIQKLHAHEHELVNSGKSPRKAKGKFASADYTLAGAVSEFEYCAGGTEGGLSLIGPLDLFSIGAEGHEAKVAVDIRLIDVETGEIAATVRGEGAVRDTALNLGVGLGGVRGKLGGYEGTPIAQAARQAIQKAVAALAPKIP